jgi:hypothetical protein
MSNTIFFLHGKACDAVAFSLQAHDLEVSAMQQDVCDEVRWQDVVATTLRNQPSFRCGFSHP